MLAGSLIYKISTDMSGLDRGLDNADRKVGGYGRKAGNRFGDEFNRGLGNTRLDTTPIERAARDGGNKVAGVLTGIFQGIGQQIANSLINAITGAVSFGVNKIKELSAFVYQVGSDFRNLQIAFRTIVGNQQKADKLLKDLRQFSAATPYTGTEVTQASQKLLTVVRPEDMVQTLQRLGDVAAGTKSRLGELATIYQQVLTKGKFQAEEMLQFAERGIPIQEEVAKVLGVQKSELEDLGRKGKITSDVMIAAFKNMAGEGGKFNGIMQQQSATAAGMASTLQDKFEQVATQIYDKVEPALQQILKSMDEALSKAGQQSSMLDIIGQAAENVSKWFQTHQDLLNKAAIAASKFAEEGMTQLVKEAETLAKYLDENPEALKEAWNGAKEFLSAMKEITATATQLIGAVVKIGSSIYKIVAGVEALLQKLPQMQAFLDVRDKILSGLGQGIESTANFVDNLGKSDPNNPYNGATATGSVTSPLAGKSFQQLMGYKPSRQQGFYGMRDGGKRQHSKVDFDSRVGGGQGAIVQAVMDGRARMRDLGTGNSVGIDIFTKDKQGRELQFVYNHLAKQEALKLFAGQREIAVSAGQRLSTVTNDSLSRGAHLDFGVKVAGRYVDPQKFMGNYLLPMQRQQAANPQLKAYNTGNNYNIPNPTRGSSSNGGVSNMTKFLHVIGYGESNFRHDLPPSSAGARGFFQFIPGTRKAAIARTGLDPNVKDPQKSAEAVVAWIKSEHPQAYAAINKGDFKTAYYLLGQKRLEWTSLPGSQESNWGKNSSFTWDTLRKFESGNFVPRFNIPGQGGSVIGYGGTSVAPKGSVSTPNATRTVKSQPIARTSTSSSAKSDTVSLAQREKQAAEQQKKIQQDLAKQKAAEAEEQRQKILQAEQEAKNSDIEVLRSRYAASNSAKDKFTLDLAEIDFKYNRDLQDITADAKEGYPKAGLDKRRANATSIRDLGRQQAKNEYQKYLQDQAEEARKRKEEAQAKINEDAEKRKQEEETKKRNQEQSRRRVRDSYISRSEATATTPEAKMQVEIDKASAKLEDLIHEIEQLGVAGEATSVQVEALKKNAQVAYGAEVSGIRDRYQREREEKELEALKQDRASNAAKGDSIRNAIATARQMRYETADSQYNTMRTLADSDLTLAQARASRITDPDKSRRANIEVGKSQIGMELASQLQAIEELGRSGQFTNEQLERMRDNAHQLSEIKLDALHQQFQSLGEQIKGSVGSAFGGFLQSVVTGTQSVGDAFKGMVNNIISSLANIAISRLITSLFGGGIGAFGNGGLVEAFSTGGQPGRGEKFNSLPDALRYERATSGRKPMLAVLHEGELVIPAKDVPKMEQISAFSRGTHSINFNGKPTPSNNSVNFGDWNFQQNADVDPARLQDMVKASVYSILQRETGSGGMLRK